MAHPRQKSCNSLYIRYEAHIEHSVGFINDQYFYIIQQNLAEGRCASVDRLIKELQLELKDYHERRGGVVVGDAQENVAVAEKVLLAIYATRCSKAGAPQEEPPAP